ncbi:hypothetical protein STH2941 [Symbiobacterium thermophilum IAM 14863]|uniref:MalT-like TPR region domain-containing protein n=2 Tax=Symbiobacterium thermophilum TaxID=2734 RepID=Q67K74_SYMTH|nr:hypothetical protein STH2941 [Symbiobacterium thermophilum IAM 14863]
MEQGGLSSVEQAGIHLIMSRCRLLLQDAPGAVLSGLSAVKLAEQEREYDLLGRALLALGAAHAAMQQFEQALSCFQRYFTYRAYYRDAARLEGAAWKSLGITYQRMLQPKQAVHALEAARTWFGGRQMEHGVFTTTHDLINVYLYLAKEDRSLRRPVRRLLIEQRGIAARRPTEPYYAGTYLLDLAAWLASGGYYGRAAAAAVRALFVHRDDPAHACHCYLLLARCELQLGEAHKALTFALAAQNEAVMAGRPELEQLAADALDEVVQREGVEILRHLDAAYQASARFPEEMPTVPLLRRDLQ